MEEMELLLAEARSFVDDILVEFDQVSEMDSPDDNKEVVQEALRLGEEAMNRLEEALDLAESDADQTHIEMAATRLEDALDAGHLSLTSDNPTADIKSMRAKLEEAAVYMSVYEEIEEE